MRHRRAYREMQASSCNDGHALMLRHCLSLFVVLALAGCDISDPYLRDGVWRPDGANDANLRAMAASPSDLVRGVPSTETEGLVAAAAIDRYRNDKARPLPDSGLAKIVPVAGGTQQGSQ